MNIRDITAAWLRCNGFDGLAAQECGCGLDDLMTCEDPSLIDCMPAKAIVCDGKCPNCEGNVGKDVCYRRAILIQTEEEETHL